MRLKAAPVLFLLALGLTPTGLRADNPFKDMFNRMANPDIQVTLKHPPSMGLKINRIAFLPTKDNNAEDLVSAATMDLSKDGQIEIVDRANLTAILKEQALGAEGYMDTSMIVKLGKLLPATAMVSVKVSNYKATNTPLTNHSSYTDKQGYQHTTYQYISKTQVEMTGSFQVTDLTTGKIFAARRFAYTPFMQNVAEKGYPEFPAEQSVREAAIGMARTEISHMFLPWTEAKKLIFFDDKDYGMKDAFARIKLQDYEGCLARSKDAQEKAKADPAVKPKYLGRVSYNLGISYFILGQEDEAIPYFKAAREFDSSSNIYLESLNECQRSIALRTEMQQVDKRTEDQRRKEAAPAAAPAATSEAAPAKATGKSGGTPEERLVKLNAMKKKGLITEQEFKKKKEEILKEM